MTTILGLVALCLLLGRAEARSQQPPCNKSNGGYACSGSSTGNAISGTSTTWQMQPNEFATVTGLAHDVNCPPGQPTQLYQWSPGWSYIPGLGHIGTWVLGEFHLHNSSNADATGIQFWLGWGNEAEGPFTVKAGEDFTVVGFAADGFSPPTTSSDYSPYIFIPATSAAGVTAIGGTPAGNGTTMFVHGFN